MNTRKSKWILCLVFGGLVLAVSGVIHAGDLIDAAEKGDLVQVKKLIEGRAANVDEENSASQTPLIWACYKGHLDVAKYLVERGANVNHKESGYGKNALMMAAEAGNIAIVELLLNKKAEVSAVNKYGGTALMSAAQHGHTDVVEMLLSHGAEIDHKGSEGQTALMLACGMGRLPVVKLLLSKRADFKLKDKAGRSPEDWATIGRHFEVVTFLQALATGKSSDTISKPAKQEQATFGQAASFSEKDASGTETKYSITFDVQGSSTGGFTPDGMRRYEFHLRIENLSDLPAKLGIGPIQIEDENGKTHIGHIYEGPVHVFVGGIEMIMGEIPNNPSGMVVLKPKQEIGKLRIFVAMPNSVKPKVLSIVIGVSQPKQFLLKYAR